MNTTKSLAAASFAGSGGGFRFRAERTKSMKSVLPETSFPGRKDPEVLPSVLPCPGSFCLRVVEMLLASTEVAGLQHGKR